MRHPPPLLTLVVDSLLPDSAGVCRTLGSLSTCFRFPDFLANASANDPIPPPPVFDGLDPPTGIGGAGGVGAPGGGGAGGQAGGAGTGGAGGAAGALGGGGGGPGAGGGPGVGGGPGACGGCIYGGC